MAGWWATLLVGLAVLLFGRRLFWLFVGAAGFLVGLHVARTLFAEQPEWVAVALALALGVLGAVLAIVFQLVAVALAGFGAGVQGSLILAKALGLEGSWLWLAAFAAGIVVAALVLWLWDPVLVVLSALVGAVLVAPLIPVPPVARPWLFVGLLVAGIVVQARVLAPPAGPPGPPPPRRGA
ncbi:MAG TPA: DUF4203 domain-containing protein [Methylomirabilota bacterium]|jgi:hypothetical protein